MLRGFVDLFFFSKLVAPIRPVSAKTRKQHRIKQRHMHQHIKASAYQYNKESMKVVRSAKEHENKREKNIKEQKRARCPGKRVAHELHVFNSMATFDCVTLFERRMSEHYD